MAKIEFKLVIRDCGHNDDVLKNKEPSRNLLRDYEVWIDGEHRGTFAKKSYSRGYDLRVEYGDRAEMMRRHEAHEYSDKQPPVYLSRAVSKPPREGSYYDHEINVDTKAEFLPTIESALAENLIPTREQLVAELEEEVQQWHKQRADAKAAHEEHLKQQAGPALYSALKVLVDHAQEAYPHFESIRGQRDIKAALAALAIAEGK